MSDAEDKIKKAWIAGVISGVVTLIITLIAMAGADFLGFSAWNLLDVALLFGLTLGIYMKSRTCAIIMLVYFIGSKLLLWKETGSLSGLPLAALFGYYFVLGIQGTFEHHSNGTENRPTPQAGPQPVPKFKSREEYEQWKANKLNTPQTVPSLSSRPVIEKEKKSSGLGWAVAVFLIAAALGAIAFTDVGQSLVSGMSRAAKPSWQEFSSTEGSFSVLMPGTPVQSKNQVNTAVGPLDMHLYSRELGSKTAYIVVYSDYPEFVARASPDKVLDGGREGAVANSKGKLISEQNIFLEGTTAGREMTIDIADKGIKMKIRAYLVRQRLYQIMVVAPREAIDSEENSHYLASFKLLST